MRAPVSSIAGGCRASPRPAGAALVALAVVVALVAVVVTVARESDVERPAAPPGKKVVATDVERGVRFSLDGRVLTVQLLPPVRNQTFETVSGAQISATCGTNVAAPPGDPRSEVTLFPALAGRRDEPELPLPARRLDLVPARPPVRRHRRARRAGPLSLGARAPIAETANKWARHFALQLSDLHRLHEPDRLQDCAELILRLSLFFFYAREWRAEVPRHETNKNIAIRGDRAAATLANDRRSSSAATQRDERVADPRVGPVRGRGS